MKQLPLSPAIVRLDPIPEPWFLARLLLEPTPEPWKSIRSAGSPAIASW
jgi:hypothetical protein